MSPCDCTHATDCETVTGSANLCNLCDCGTVRCDWCGRVAS